jgi:hypothetical protein
MMLYLFASILILSNSFFFNSEKREKNESFSFEKMKIYIILFYLLNALCINNIRTELCHAMTTVNPYYRYHKCQTTDMIFKCEDCDEYQPSCNSDGECGNGNACCKASCSPSSCNQCQGIKFSFIIDSNKL